MTNILIRDLQPGTQYAVQLRANSGDGVSQWSPRFLITADADTEAPTAPTWAAVNPWIPDGTSFVATWEPIDYSLTQNKDFSRYELVISDGTKSITINTRDTAYVLTLEMNSSRFGTPKPSLTAKVRAVDATGNASVYTSTQTATNAVPGSPTSVVATAGTDSVSLTWTPPADTDLIGYNIYTSSDVKIGFINATSYTYITTNYTSQSFKVAAVDAFGQVSTKTASNAVTPVTPFVLDTTPPADVTSVNVTFSDVGTIPVTRNAVVTWTAPSDTDLAGYYVRWKKSADATWNMRNVSKTETSAIITDLTPNISYDFAVRAYDRYANFSTNWVVWSGNTGTTTVVPTIFDAIKIGGGGYIESTSFGAGVGFRIDDDSITIHNGSIDGQAITTGLIRSNQPAVDAAGNPIVGQYAWQIDLEGDAILGNAWVRGNLTIGDTNDAYLSVIQSANYVSGVSGWRLSSDGDGDLRGLSADTIDGDSIVANTLSISKLSAGGISDEISLESGSSLIARGLMGEKVGLGDYGFEVSGPQENTVTLRSASSTTVTLTTAVPHNFIVGQKIVVSIGETRFDGEWTVDTVVSATEFTYQTTDATTVASAAVSNGVVKGANPALSDGPIFISFPTDGTEPNIISGELTSSIVVVTEGMSIRKTSNIEQGAKLIINYIIEAPKSAPTVSQTYGDMKIEGYDTTPKGIAKGHNGNYFVLSGANNKVAITEHSATSGKLIASRYNLDGGTYTPKGLVYTSQFGGRYYLFYYFYSPGMGHFNFVRTFDTSWTLLNTYTIDSINHDSLPKSTMGWDFTNNRLMIGWRDGTSSVNVSVIYLTMDAVTGYPTGYGSISTVSYSGTGSLAFIARGDFDFGTGADRIIVKDMGYHSAQLSSAYFAVALNTGAQDANNLWPVANFSNIGGAFWDTAISKFIDINTSGIRRQYEGGDSKWTTTEAGSVSVDTRFVRYAWYRSGSDLETNLSPAAQVSLTKRARMSVTIAPVPYNSMVASTPDKARVYVLDNLTDTFPTVTNYRLRVTISSNSVSGDIDPYNLGTTGTAQATVNDFTSVSGDPGQIVSSTGKSFWKGDDTAQFYRLKLSGNFEATENSGNTPPLLIGEDSKTTELRIDSDEIIFMATSTTRNVGKLRGSQLNFDVTGGVLVMESGSNISGKLRNQVSPGGAAYVIEANRLIAGIGTYNAAGGPSGSNTVNFHASELHSWTGGIFMEDLSGGGVTGANINNAGRVVRTSTINMKEAIEEMTKEEAKSVLGLKSYTFEFKESDGLKDPRRYPGFIAEQGAEAGAELWVARKHKPRTNEHGNVVGFERDKKGEIVAFRTGEITVAHNMLISELFDEIGKLKKTVARLASGK